MRQHRDDPRDEQPDDRRRDGEHVDDGELAALWDDPSIAPALEHLAAPREEPLPSDVRDRHLVTIRTQAGATAPARRRPARVRSRRLAPLLVGVLALALVAAGGTVAAAQDADPDDTLYAVKRTSERVWLAVPRGGDGAARAHLSLADRRLHEARRAPHHAEELTAQGIQHAEFAEDELPEEALETFERLLGDGEGRLPDQASPRARVALHRNCVRLSERLGTETDRCGDTPDPGAHPGRGRGLDGEHPGRGVGRDGEHPGRGVGRDGEHPGRGVGRDGEHPGRGVGRDGEHPGRGVGREGEHPGRGWGPGGRPDGAEGPPPRVQELLRDRPGDRADGSDARD
jgi:hypothetical protein